MKFLELDTDINKVLQEGTVIPAHPLALQENLKLDEKRQRLLTQYYIPKQLNLTRNLQTMNS